MTEHGLSRGSGQHARDFESARRASNDRQGMKKHARLSRRRVLEAKPGITGLWQVTGRSSTTLLVVEMPVPRPSICLP